MNKIISIKKVDLSLSGWITNKTVYHGNIDNGNELYLTYEKGFLRIYCMKVTKYPWGILTEPLNENEYQWKSNFYNSLTDDVLSYDEILMHLSFANFDINNIIYDLK